MKFFMATLGILGAGLLGFFLEPELRYGLTGQEPVRATVAATPTPSELTPIPVAQNYDYSKIQPNQLPDKVTLKSEAAALAPGETESLPLKAGTKVKPLRIEGSYLCFSVLGAAEGKIAVDKTDLVAQLLANPPPAPTPVPVEPTPPVVAKVDPVPAPEPEVVTPVPTPDPAPVPDPAPATPATASLSPEDVVKIMQESIRTAQVKEFTFDQVLGWKASENEVVDGETYQTGLAAYKAETIFGVKNIQAKALIKDGKVIRWIWPTSGLEIQ